MLLQGLAQDVRGLHDRLGNMDIERHKARQQREIYDLEVIQRLTRIEGEVRTTNGRVTSLEDTMKVVVDDVSVIKARSRWWSLIRSKLSKPTVIAITAGISAAVTLFVNRHV